jgi:hypothetical protein
MRDVCETALEEEVTSTIATAVQRLEVAETGPRLPNRGREMAAHWTACPGRTLQVMPSLESFPWRSP